MEEFDFLVIGSGSGLDVANVAANRGQSVAVVEKGPLGGTCLNRGCIPSKQLLYHADVYETVEGAGEFHIDAEIEDVDFAEMVREVNEDVGESSSSIRQGLRSSDQHRLFEGEGRFVDDRTVEIHGGEDDRARVRAETVLIAAGTRPGIPNIDGIESVDYLTSTEALELPSPPDRLVIVGGGYIAAELGHFFGTFGSDVTILGRRPRLLPNTDTLDLEHTAVETDDAGFVETDEYLETDAEGVWALGDIVGEYLLKHSANHEAQSVARNIFGEEPEPVDYSAMPYAVFGSPEVAGVGATEDELRAADREYATNTYRFDETARGDAMGADGFVKVLIDLEGEILGCHIVGPDASTLIQEVVTAMTAGSGTVRDIRESIHVHPALPEVVQRAFSGQFSRGGGGHQHNH